MRALLKAKAYNDAVKEQMASELRIAREIQMGMLPSDFAPLEINYGIGLAGVLEPAREVGGDLYGVCAAGPDRLVLFLGDVSGKGIPAALFMVRAITLARLLAREIAEPERILERLNDELTTDNPYLMFVTFLCGVFEPSSGRLALASAGHCYPILLVPILGINLGRFGFLMEIQEGQWRACLPRLVQGDYLLEKRMMLCTEQWRSGTLLGTGMCLTKWW